MLAAVSDLRCLIRSPTTLQRRRYDRKELETCKRCFYTIMASYDKSSEAIDCHIHSVRYDMVLESRACGRLRWPHQVTYAVVAKPIRSPTTLQRRRYDQKELEPCKRCFYTIMASYDKSSEAIDCHIHSVRYNMVLESRACGRLRYLIRSPTTLQRRRYDQKELEPCKRCFYTIMASYDKSSEAIDCHIHSVRYNMVLESRACGRLRWPHQVSYDVVATSIRSKRA
eukprot:scaffold4846_cov152-Skeletonema_marinoi.AAC.14